MMSFKLFGKKCMCLSDEEGGGKAGRISSRNRSQHMFYRQWKIKSLVPVVGNSRQF